MKDNLWTKIALVGDPAYQNKENGATVEYSPGWVSSMQSHTTKCFHVWNYGSVLCLLGWTFHLVPYSSTGLSNGDLEVIFNQLAVMIGQSYVRTIFDKLWVNTLIVHQVRLKRKRNSQRLKRDIINACRQTCRDRGAGSASLLLALTCVDVLVASVGVRLRNQGQLLCHYASIRTETRSNCLTPLHICAVVHSSTFPSSTLIFKCFFEVRMWAWHWYNFRAPELRSNQRSSHKKYRSSF